MSARKKLMICLVPFIIIAGCSWLLFKLFELPEPDFSYENKVELLSYVITERYANEIREAGYGIPTDSVIRRGGIDNLEINGELKLDVRPPSSGDDASMKYLQERSKDTYNFIRNIEEGNHELEEME